MKKPVIKNAIVAVDIVLFSIVNNRLNVLIIEVNRPPYYKKIPGFPGGLILPKETTDGAAIRILKEKTAVLVKDIYIEQLYTFSDVKRDKRGRVVSVSYLGLISPNKVGVLDEKKAQWMRVRGLPALAYDHDEMLEVALARLRSKLEYTNIARYLLPAEFTLSDLQDTYEIVLGRGLDRRNFRKKVKEVDLVKKTGRQKRGEPNRPAELYRFNRKKVYITEVL